MKVKYKKLNEDAKTPYKKYDDDFCYDLYASSDAMPVYDDNGNLIPNLLKYETGIAFEIVRDKEVIFKDHLGEKYFCDQLIDFRTSPLKLSIDARPRSSVFKTGLSLANCEGTIDEPFRGGVCVYFYDIIPELPKYKKGDRIVQVKVGITFPIEWVESEELSGTERGSGGFGHTGK